MTEAWKINDAGSENNFFTYNYRLAGRLWRLYVNNSSKYIVCRDGIIYQPKVKANGRPQCLTMKKIQGHLGCFYNIGVFASAKSAKFICFDVDVPDKDLVRRLIETLVGFGFPKQYIYPSLSGGKGYHVEIFSKDPVANATLYKLYRVTMESGGFDRNEVEFRPQEGLSVRMPLSAHYKTGQRGWYCNVDTLEPIETTDYLFEIKQMTRDLFCEIVGKLKLKSNGLRKGGYRIKEPDHMLLETKEHAIPMVTEPHTRHEKMKKYATFLRGCGYEAAEIYNKLMAWVDVQERSLMESSDEEIEQDARLLAEWAGAHDFRNSSAKLVRERGRAEFDAADLNYILNGANCTDWRILFRSVLAQKVFGRDQASYRLIGECIGAHEMTVYKRIHKLEGRGVVKLISGKTVKKTGTNHFFSTSTSYVPGDRIEQVLDTEDFVGPWRMLEVLRWKNGMWLYANAMMAMLGDKLAKYVGESEAKAIKAIIDGGRQIETECWYTE